jgi:hypothetical protein
MSQYYEYLIQTRHDELVREAGRRRLSRAIGFGRRSRWHRGRRILAS